MSRTTATSSSLMPRMIWPSTKACAGALVSSILMPVLLQHLDVEVRILLEDRPRVVADRARGQHRQRAAAQQRVQARVAGAAQAHHLVAGKDVQATGGRNARAHRGVATGGAGTCIVHQ